MFYEKLAQAKQEKKREKPSLGSQAVHGLRTVAPTAMGIPMLGSGLYMIADPDSTNLGRGAGAALAVGGGALLAEALRYSRRNRRKQRED